MPLKDLLIETPASEPVVIATRDFAAPRRLVWKVMTEPEHVARWWGTAGQKNVITSFDVRPGGKWRVESHDPDGNVYIFVGEYREVVAPERFVWTFGMENMFFGKTLVETHTFEGSLLVPLDLTVRAVDGLRVYIDVAPPRARDVELTLRAQGLRASVLQRVAGVEGEVKRFVSKYVAKEVDKPHIRRARVFDVGEQVDRAWASIAPRSGEAETAAEIAGDFVEALEEGSLTTSAERVDDGPTA